MTLTVTQEFIEPVSMTDTTTVDDISSFLVGALDQVDLDWAHAVSLATDGAQSMIGKKAGVGLDSERRFVLQMEEIFFGQLVMLRIFLVSGVCMPPELRLIWIDTKTRSRD